MANNVKVWLYQDLGTSFGVEVTSYAVNVSITRGKSRTLDVYNPGSISIQFNNYDRTFDVTNSFSPLYTYIKPKQLVRVFLDSGIMFSGLVDDWSFNYNVNGEAMAYLTATEKTSLFANQYLPAQTFPAELSGARINRILSDDFVAWPDGAYDRDISVGTQMLEGDTIVSNTNVLEYLRQIESSEQGNLYIQGSDTLTFKDNSFGINSSNIYATFADDGTGYGYEAIDVSYDSQLLYNRIQIDTWDGLTSITANSSDSQTIYGIYKLSIDGILYTDDNKLKNLASFISSKYSQPEYRIYWKYIYIYIRINSNILYGIISRIL